MHSCNSCLLHFVLNIRSLLPLLFFTLLLGSNPKESMLYSLEMEAKKKKKKLNLFQQCEQLYGLSLLESRFSSPGLAAA